jgi:cytolysin (calcineurin-like family phosphatase)
MQVYAYTCSSVVMIGLLIGIGYLYKIEKAQASDSVLMFILGQVLSAWVALTNKIFRITTPNINNPDN